MMGGKSSLTFDYSTYLEISDSTFVLIIHMIIASV